MQTQSLSHARTSLTPESPTGQLWSKTLTLSQDALPSSSHIMRSWLPLWYRRKLGLLGFESSLGTVHLSGKQLLWIYDSGHNARNSDRDRLSTNLVFFNRSINCVCVYSTKLQKVCECLTLYLLPFQGTDEWSLSKLLLSPIWLSMHVSSISELQGLW